MAVISFEILQPKVRRKTWLFRSLGGYSSGGASSSFHLHPPKVRCDESLNRLKTAKKGLKATLSLPWGFLQSTEQVNKTEVK